MNKQDFGASLENFLGNVAAKKKPQVLKLGDVAGNINVAGDPSLVWMSDEAGIPIRVKKSTLASGTPAGVPFLVNESDVGNLPQIESFFPDQLDAADYVGQNFMGSFVGASGQVGYAGTDQNLTSNAALRWTGSQLRIVKDVTGSYSVTVYDDTNEPFLIGTRAGGDQAAPTGTPNAGNLLRISGAGHGASGFTTSRARIDLRAAEAFDDTSQGAKIVLWTTPLGSTTPREVLAIDSTGDILASIGKIIAKPATTAGIQLDPNSATGNFTLSLSPANLTADRRFTLPDANFTVTGGGTYAGGGFTLTVPATGTVALMAYANAGNFGLGVTPATYKLEILTGATNGIKLTGSGATPATMYIGQNPTAGDWQWRTNVPFGSSTIDDSGNPCWIMRMGYVADDWSVFRSPAGATTANVQQVAVNSSGQFIVRDGTVSLPTISFIADLNTGFYRTNVDEIGVALGGYQSVNIAGSATKFRRDGAGQFDDYQLVWLRRGAAGAAISSADVVGDFAFNAQLAAGETQIALMRVSAPDASASYSSQIDFYTSKAGTLGASLTIDANRNLLIGGLSAMGSSVVSGIGIVSGTAPSSSPADMAQLWVADANATAGKAWPHMRPEDGTSRVIMGIESTSGISTGVVTIKTNGTTARDNVGWIKTHDHAGNIIYIPYLTTITG